MSMELGELLNKIEAECHLDLEKTLLERMAASIPQQEPFFYETDIEPAFYETDMEPNVFSVRNENFVITVSSKADFDEYQQRILQLQELEKWVNTNQDISGMDFIVNYMKTMIQNIYTRKQPVYQAEKDNAQVLAKYVEKNILDKYIKNISVSILREMQSDKKQGKDSQVMLSLLACLNRYLKKLGVYTIMAMEGMPYKTVADYYELLNGVQLQNQNPVICGIDHPAYLIDYVSRDGSHMQRCVNGRCIGK